MTQNALWLLVGMLGVAIPMIALAQRAAISYPIVLVLSGLVLGFIPGLPHLMLEPDLFLIAFLPPLLYWEAIMAPVDAMRRHEAAISGLVIGLVVITTFAVAYAAHATIPAMPWAVAFALGAIVAPTDALAAAPVLNAMKMPRSLVAIVEGESLLNDASALIIYGAAVTAIVTGTFSFPRVLANFVVAGIGGVVIGWLVALAARELWRRVKDANLQMMVSVTSPFVAFLTADRLGMSSTLAAVFAGIISTRWIPTVTTAEARLQALGFWNTAVFLANAILFVLLGLQLNDLAKSVFAEYSWQTLVTAGVVITATVLLVRIAWFVGNEYVPGLPLVSGAGTKADWRRALVAAWSGMRGAVSLAAALAIPLITTSGAPVPQRDLVIFLTFAVILATLVGCGLTLPFLIRLLGLSTTSDEESLETQSALLAMRRAAATHVEELVRRGDVSEQHAELLRGRSERRLSHHAADTQREIILEREHEIIMEERAALVSLRDRGEVDNTVLLMLQRRLDLAEAALPRIP